MTGEFIEGHAVAVSREIGRAAVDGNRHLEGDRDGHALAAHLVDEDGRDVEDVVDQLDIVPIAIGQHLVDQPIGKLARKMV